MRNFRFLGVVLLVALVACGPEKKSAREDTQALAAAGKFENQTYFNNYAGLKVHMPQPPCEPALNTMVDPKGTVYLVNCVYPGKDRNSRYAFMVLTDIWANYSDLKSADEYVHTMRLVAERNQNVKMVEAETRHTMAKLDFWETILSEHAPAGTYYKGMTCTHFKAYALCFEAEATSLETVRSLLNLEGKLQ